MTLNILGKISKADMWHLLVSDRRALSVLDPDLAYIEGDVSAEVPTDTGRRRLLMFG
jgi:hypothetical protein